MAQLDHSLAYAQRTQYLTPSTLAQPWLLPLYSARKQEQPKCPSTDGKIMKAWHTCTMEFYSTVQKNKIMKPAGN